MRRYTPLMVRVVHTKIRTGRRVAVALLAVILNRCRVLYNAALEERIAAWKVSKTSISFYDQCKSLTQIRSDDPDYGELNATMTRMTVLDRLDKAFKAFFRHLKRGEKAGFPRFKGKDRFDTLIFGANGWKIVGTRLTIRGVGWFRLTSPPYRVGVPKGLRLVRKGERWEAHIIYEFPDVEPVVKPDAKSIGVDVGIRTFAAMSDGSVIQHPHFLRRAASDLVTSQRVLASKKKGSHRRSRAKVTVAKLHYKIANRRKDFLHKASRQILNANDCVVVEDLKIQTMMQGNGSTRSLRHGIMDSAWSIFMYMLSYKAEEAGKRVVRVDPRGTSQRCNRCGSVVAKNLSVRVHECLVCGFTADRDVNAALNINDLGRRSAGLTPCGGPL